MKKIILILFVLLLIIYFLFTFTPLKQYVSIPQIPQLPFTITQTIYSGKLPCADCSGIDATLTMSSNNTYTQVYVYEGKNTSFTEKGTWKEIKGTPKDPGALVYQLIPEGTGNKTYYAVDGNQLKPLDDTMKEISSPFNLNLTRQ